MSFDAVSLNLELPGAGDAAFARAAQEALSPVLRPLPRDFAVDTAAAAEGGFVGFPGKEPLRGALSAADLPVSRNAALFAAPFGGGPPRWLTHAAFAQPRWGPALVAVAGLWLYVDRGVATVSIGLNLAGFPLTDVTLETRDGEGVLVRDPGRSARTDDWHRVTAALFALTAAFRATPERRWIFDLTARVAYEDYQRLEALRVELNEDR